VRAFQAIGAAAAMSVSMALIRSIYPVSRLGRGLSFNTVIASGFATLAPSVGGAILAVARWPWLFASVVPFGLLSLVIGQKSLPEPVTRDDPYDVLAAVMCAATFGFAITGLETAVHGNSPVISAALVALGVALGVLFVRRELGQSRPVLPVVPAGLLGGIGMIIAIMGMISLASLRASPDQFDVVWRVGLCGLGFGMFYSPNSRLIVASAPIERSAAAGGLTTTLRGAGQTLGATTAAILLATGVGTGPAPALVAAGLAAIAGLCCLAVLKTPIRREVFVDVAEP